MRVPGRGAEARESPPGTAEAWLARRRAGPLSAAEQRAFDTWRDESPRNAAEYERLTRLWDSMESVRADPAVLAMREHARAEVASRSRRRLMQGLMAAGVACMLAAGAIVLHLERQERADVRGERVVEYRTRVGQKSTVKLADGSLLVLDTDSVLEAWSTARERRIRLLRGRAFFNVAKDTSRPFSVSAGGNTVTAVGTEFDVELKPAAMEVTLLSGRLRVSGAREGHGSAPAVMEMNAGHRLIAPAGKPWTVRKADSRIDTGWLRGQLVFDEETLGNIAEALNRYSTKKIVIRDPAVAHKTLSAVLAAGDVDSFIQSAETLGLARPGENDSRHVELVAP